MLRLVCSEQKIIEHSDLGGVCQLNDKCYVVSVLTEFVIFEAALIKPWLAESFVGIFF